MFVCGAVFSRSKYLQLFQSNTKNFMFAVDEGSYEPNPTLIEIRKVAEKTMETAHKMNIVKTKAEADNEPDSDWTPI